MIAMKGMALAAGIGFLVGAIPAGYFAYKFTTNSWIAATEKLKNQAAAELHKAAEKVIFAERKNAKLATRMDAEHAKSQKVISATLDENRRLVYAAGGLRDKGRRAGSSSSVRPTPATPCGASVCAPGADISGADEGLLSPETSEFILKLAHDADEVAGYANTCHEWIKASRTE